MTGPEDIDGDLQSLSSNDDGSHKSAENHAKGSSSSERTSTDQPSDEEKREIARKETEMVFRLRVLVIMVLLCAGAGVCVIVYYITSNADSHESNSEYDASADNVLEAFLEIAQIKLAAVTSLTIAETSYARDQGNAWPFVTLSDLQQRASTMRAQSGALIIQIHPMVNDSDRREWEDYVGREKSAWIADGLEYQKAFDLFGLNSQHATNSSTGSTNSSINFNNSIMWSNSSTAQRYPDPGPGPYFPQWQSSPVYNNASGANTNLLSLPGSSGALVAFDSGSLVFGDFVTSAPGGADSNSTRTSYFSILLSTAHQKLVEYKGDPMSRVFFPIFDSFESNRSTVGIIVALINWGSYFENILPDNVVGIVTVLHDSCGGDFTYRIDGSEVVALGSGDLHHNNFNSRKKSASFDVLTRIADGTSEGLPVNHNCTMSLDVYPSEEFYDSYNTRTPVMITLAVAFIFVFTVLMFLIYDRLVERRQAIVQRKAQQTSAIVSSLFPKNVRDRLLEEPTNGMKTTGYEAPNRRLKSFLSNGTEDGDNTLQPIADLFPNCTVLFADIAGFTAWSSTRDPTQVFILLQTVYQAFDTIAKRRRVFKVETIGDSYMAVTGLPEPQQNHAVIMARFAGECKERMRELTIELGRKLGPDTGDLTLRFGMHSGPVTAGVLRGDRARFQLFGDTVNTASRMESTGMSDRIQISQTTHDLLVDAGKSHWMHPRADMVQVKGKGTLVTYWLSPNAKRASSTSGSTSSETKERAPAPTTLSFPKGSMGTQESHMAKKDRLVDWMVEMLQEHIKKLNAMRTPSSETCPAVYESKPRTTPLDEVAEVITLPRYEAKSFAQEENELSAMVLWQLREYVSIVASTYNENPFHNFEHACHVTMAANKFIKRIVSPDIIVEEDKIDDVASTLHEYTHGITSDPLTIIAILFSALIHDVDHRGVSNAQLIVEQKEMASLYRNKSIAEQNSLDIAWDLLMTNQFKGLRACLFTNATELERFRQVMVNVVLATDIFDTELNNLRKQRWNKAFSTSDLPNEIKDNLRATIVIEHIIQASDVSHTMQHWHVYQKWNKRLFLEMHTAYVHGRMAKDPSTFWYDGELGFFDNYIIPLAKKLKDCNVFGVSSDECLNYAIQNRAEWADRGKEILAELITEVSTTSSPSHTNLTSLVPISTRKKMISSITL